MSAIMNYELGIRNYGIGIKVILITFIIHYSLFIIPVNAQQNQQSLSLSSLGGVDKIAQTLTPQQKGLAKEVVNNTASFIGSGILSVTGKVIGFVIYIITYFIGYIAGILFTLGGLFLSFGLRLNGTLLQSPTVNIGWMITRDLANLGFVLGIIYVAIATILRVSPYGIKDFLFRFVTVALLINFSLTIAGVFIDMSGLMTNFFISKVVPPPTTTGTSFQGVFQNQNGLSFAASLANTFGIQEALRTNEKNWNLPKYQGITEFGITMIQTLANLFFVALFTIIGAITMLTIAALVYVRYVYLTILLILMPIAWLGAVFPGTQLGEQYKLWWRKFMEWIIWLPVASFFIYLTILIVTNQAEDANSIIGVAKSITTSPQGTALDNFLGLFNKGFETIGRMLAVLGLLIGGLAATGKISDGGAKTVLGFVGKAQGYLTGKVSNAAKATATGFGVPSYVGGRALQRFLRGGGQSEGPEGQKAVLPRGQRLVTGLSKYGKYVGLSGAASGLSNYIAKGKDEVAEYQKKYLSNLNDDALQSYTTSFGDRVTLAAKASELAKRDKLPGHKADEEKRQLTDYEKKEIKIYADVVKEMGVDKDFLSNRPDLAPEFGKKVDDVVRKLTDLSNISKEALKKMDVQIALSTNQYQQLRKNNKVTEDKIIALKDGIRGSYDNIKSEIAKGGHSVEKLAELQKKQEKLAYRLKIVNTPAFSIKEAREEMTETAKDILADKGMTGKAADSEVKKIVKREFEEFKKGT